METDLMSFTTTEVIRLVAGFSDHAEAWDEFHSELLNNEAVELGPGGFAYIVEDIKPERDSYGYLADGPASFVFRLSNRGDAQHFRKSGYSDSYDDTTFNGDLEEVQPKAVSVSAWERI